MSSMVLTDSRYTQNSVWSHERQKKALIISPRLEQVIVDLRARIQEMFITMLSDNVEAREQQPDGTYVCLTPEENAPLNSQEYFFDAAYAAAENNNFR